jgi:hypothetical protein
MIRFATCEDGTRCYFESHSEEATTCAFVCRPHVTGDADENRDAHPLRTPQPSELEQPFISSRVPRHIRTHEKREDTLFRHLLRWNFLLFRISF